MIDFSFGNDVFSGRATSKIQIEMGRGNDTYKGLGGNDTGDGNFGDDLLDFSQDPSAITLSMSATDPQAYGPGTLQLTGFEHLRDSAFDDHMIAAAGTNTLALRGGSDTVMARGGDDLINADIAAGETLTALGGSGATPYDRLTFIGQQSFGGTSDEIHGISFGT